MADNYFDYLYGVNGKEEKAVTDEKPTTPDTVAQDEAIGKPWTHKFTVYCSNPSKEFIESLKKGDCVVAVYEKSKETVEPEKEEGFPSNE